nr:MAG TPA: hypothetical protein [Caudoviricetes sp.]
MVLAFNVSAPFFMALNTMSYMVSGYSWFSS